MRWMAAARQQVIVLVRGFDEQVCYKCTIFYGHCGIQEVDTDFGIVGRKFDGVVEWIDVLYERFQVIFTMGPDHEDIINKA